MRSIIPLFFLLAGCVTQSPPVIEYNLALVALEAARKFDSAKWASGQYHKAEESCRRAQILYRERYYREAKAEFEKCRLSAEKAENIARLEKWKRGEIF